MDNSNGNYVCAVLLVEVIKVRSMLEVVCVDFTGLNNIVRLNEIRELYNVKSDALCGKNLFGNLKNFLVWCGGGCDGNFCALESVVIY